MGKLYIMCRRALDLPPRWEELLQNRSIKSCVRRFLLRSSRRGESGEMPDLQPSPRSRKTWPPRNRQVGFEQGALLLEPGLGQYGVWMLLGHPIPQISHTRTLKCFCEEPQIIAISKK